MITFITAITNNEPYTTYVKALEESFKRFKLPYELVHYQNRLSWVKNTHEKPKIIRRLLSTYDKVVWLDADSVLHKEPEFFYDIKKEIGLHWNIRKSKSKLPYIMSAVMYFTNSKRCLDLLDDWIAACKDDYSHSDDQILDRVIGKHFTFDEIGAIPATYCKLDDRYHDIRDEDIVVKQFRASTTVPKEKLPHAVRLVADGTYRLIRENKESREYLDANFDRVDDWTWKPRFKDIIANIKNICINHPVVNIIGKGPSLDTLSINDLFNVPTICINDSVKVLEAANYRPLYCVVQDQDGLGSYEPLYADLICSQKAFPKYKSISAINAYSYGKNIGSDYSLPITDHTPTVIVALILAKVMGANSCRMFAFDSITKKQYTYAKSVETKKEVNMSLITQHTLIQSAIQALRLELEWIVAPSWVE